MSQPLVKSLKLITLDATGTILQFKQNPTKIYSLIAAKRGIIVEESKLKSNFKKQWKLMNQNDPHFGKDWKVWWANFVVGTFKNSLDNPPLPTNELTQLAQDLIKHFTTCECWEVSPGAIQLLDKLESFKPHLKLGVISNFDPRLRILLQIFDLAKYFDIIVLSHELQLSKPDKLIFDVALKEAFGDEKVDKSQLLHFGDNYLNDYVGAEKAGWGCGLLIKEREELDLDKRFVFRSIGEFEKFLLGRY